VLNLSVADQLALDGLGWNARNVRHRRDLIADGERPSGVNLIMSGWACRYKVLRSGSRQITAILMPGDFCDLHVTMLAKMDHGIAALSPVTVARVSRRDLEDLRAERPAISLGLDWMTMVDLATLRAWITNLGQMNALGRVAHLICELHQRGMNIGQASLSSLPFYLTQNEIADATGQTSVHVNRIISDLRSRGLASVDRKFVTITDRDGLHQIAGFDPGYLHAQHLTHK